MNDAGTADPLSAALHYAAHGWLVFPCRGKLPLIAGGRGFRDATTDREQITAWFTRWPDANIGLWPGPSGLIVIDVDGAVGRATAVALDLLPRDTVAVNTPGRGGGLHLYYRRPCADTIGNIDIGDGLDVRCDNGYVLLPPSVHPNGQRYTWAHGDLPIHSLPDAAYAAVMDAIRPTERPQYDHVYARPRAGRRYVIAAIERECEELARQHPDSHNRNKQLNRAAFSLARFVESGEANGAELRALLSAVAKQTGLGEREIERTIDSAFTARGIA